MANDPRSRVYLETTVFVAALIGDSEPYHEDALAAIRFAQTGGIEGVYSGLVIAEMMGCPTVRAPQSMPKTDVERRVSGARAFLKSCEFLTVDLAKRVGDRAAELAITHSLKGADACHLAMAEWSRCGALYTLDWDLLKVGDLGGMRVCRPESPMSAPGTLGYAEGVTPRVVKGPPESDLSPERHDPGQ